MANEYAFDPTGTLPANRITDEQIIVLAPGDRKFHFTMPRWAPFFEDGLLVKLKDINNVTTTLVMGVDYYLSHKYADASLATMHPVWGSITFLDRTIVGTVIVSYNTLGGVWTLEANEIATILLNTAINPRITTWENVTNRPIDFPVINHPWNLDDMVGQKELLEEIENFHNDWLTTIGLNTGAAAILNNHLSDFNNPHNVTAAQTGAYTKAEVDTSLTSYLLKTETAVNSNKFNNKTYQQIFTDVVNTKVNNAFNADNANSANNSINSDKLNGKTLAQIMADASNLTVSNSNKFNNKTYQELLDDIILYNSGNITNALTLQNKTLAQIMADVVNIKVNNAFNADNSDKLNGKTLAQIMADVVNTNVNNAAKLDGHTYQDIIDSVQNIFPTNALTLQNKTLAQIMADVVNTNVNNAANADNSDKLNGKTLAQVMTDVEGVIQTYILNEVNKIYSKKLSFKIDDINVPTGYTEDRFYVEIGEIVIPLDENNDFDVDNIYDPFQINIYINDINNGYGEDINIINTVVLDPNFNYQDIIKIKSYIFNNLGKDNDDRYELIYKVKNVNINGTDYTAYVFFIAFFNGYISVNIETNYKNILLRDHLDLEFINKNDIGSFLTSERSYVVLDHQFKKTNIGLGNVENYGIATITEAEDGIVKNKYMTPFLTNATILSKVNLSNYYTKAEVDAKLQQLNNNLIAYINSL